MRHLIATCFALACAGCATPGDVVKTDPIAVFRAETSVDAFTACAAPKLKDTWPLTYVEQVGDVQRIFAVGRAWGPVPAVIDVYTSSQGTIVEVRLGPGHWNGITKTLKSCS